MQIRIIICLLFLTMIVVAVLYGLREVADSVDLATSLAIWGAAALVEIGIAFTWTGDKRAVFKLTPRRRGGVRPAPNCRGISRRYPKDRYQTEVEI